MNWQIEHYDVGNPYLLKMVSFMQIITDPPPAGTKGKPVPMDEDYIVVVTENGDVKLPIDKIKSFEKLGKAEENNFLFKLEGNFNSTGAVRQPSPISEIVLQGITKDYSMNVALMDIDKAERTE